MKNFLITVSMAFSALIFSAAPASSQELELIASRVFRNVSYLYEQSIRVGDRGYELEDLARLRSASSDFLYRQDYNNLNALENALRVSSTSWIFLNSYRYDTLRFMDVKNDISVISSVMRRPIPQPIPHPRPGKVITVTNEGSGGTTNGDRSAACDRANERALSGLPAVCGNQRGLLLTSSGGSCDCRKKAGSRDDYTCRVVAVGSCQVR